jgi:hypothetical protein
MSNKVINPVCSETIVWLKNIEWESIDAKLTPVIDAIEKLGYEKYFTARFSEFPFDQDKNVIKSRIASESDKKMREFILGMPKYILTYFKRRIPKIFKPENSKHVAFVRALILYRNQIQDLKASIVAKSLSKLQKNAYSVIKHDLAANMISFAKMIYRVDMNSSFINDLELKSDIFQLLVDMPIPLEIKVSSTPCWVGRIQGGGANVEQTSSNSESNSDSFDDVNIADSEDCCDYISAVNLLDHYNDMLYNTEDDPEKDPVALIDEAELKLGTAKMFDKEDIQAIIEGTKTAEEVASSVGTEPSGNTILTLVILRCIFDLIEMIAKNDKELKMEKQKREISDKRASDLSMELARRLTVDREDGEKMRNRMQMRIKENARLKTEIAMLRENDQSRLSQINNLIESNAQANQTVDKALCVLQGVNGKSPEPMVVTDDVGTDEVDKVGGGSSSITDYSERLDRIQSSLDSLHFYNGLEAIAESPARIVNSNIQKRFDLRFGYPYWVFSLILRGLISYYAWKTSRPEIFGCGHKAINLIERLLISSMADGSCTSNDVHWTPEKAIIVHNLVKKVSETTNDCLQRSLGHGDGKSIDAKLTEILRIIMQMAASSGVGPINVEEEKMNGSADAITAEMDKMIEEARAGLNLENERTGGIDASKVPDQYDWQSQFQNTASYKR